MKTVGRLTYMDQRGPSSST